MKITILIFSSKLRHVKVPMRSLPLVDRGRGRRSRGHVLLLPSRGGSRHESFRVTTWYTELVYPSITMVTTWYTELIYPSVTMATTWYTELVYPSVTMTTTWYTKLVYPSVTMTTTWYTELVYPSVTMVTTWYTELVYPSVTMVTTWYTELVYPSVTMVTNHMIHRTCLSICNHGNVISNNRKYRSLSFNQNINSLNL